MDTRRNRSAADSFVITLAQIQSCTVVTGEGATGNLDRPNIPDVCTELGVPCVGLLKMIRSEGGDLRLGIVGIV